MQKIVIIGAGPAGLSAAYKILKSSNDYQVLIFEEESQVGGISKTINYKGNRIDIGGHRFFTKDKEVEKIWTDILKIQSKKSYDDKKLHIDKKLPKKGLDPEKDDNVMLIRNRVSRIFYKNKFFDYPVSINLKTIRNLGFTDTILSGFSYLKYSVFKKSEDNLEDFYINRFGKKLYSMFFEGYTEKVWGRKPKEISKEWGEQRVKGISIKEVVKNYFCKIFRIKQKNKETSLIEQFYYPKFGPGEFYEELAKEVVSLGGKIIKNSKVVKVNKIRNKIDSITYIKGNIEYTEKLDILISSMPIKDLINSMNNVSKKVKNISNNLPYRDFITVGLLVDKLVLKNMTNIKTLNNIIPDCWLYIQDTNVKLGRIQIFNNWSPYLVKDVDNSVWLGLEYCCNESDHFWNMSDKEIKNFSISELKKINIIDDNTKIIDSCCYKIKKAYPAYFDSYSEIDLVKDYLNKIDNLYCIGRNGQHRYNNMDHSMKTGIIAAKYIAYNKGCKEDIWNVNTEKSYHEEGANNG